MSPALSQSEHTFIHTINRGCCLRTWSLCAFRLLSELESPAWWPFGKLPWNRKCQLELGKAEATAPPPEGAARSSKEILSVPVVFYRGGDINAADVNSGALVLLVSALEVFNANGRLIHRFHKQEVDEIRVHGVCDISVRQRHIGKPDVCFRLLSAKMAEALCVLEMQYKKKVEFARDYTGFQATPSDDITPGSAAFWGAGTMTNQTITQKFSTFILYVFSPVAFLHLDPGFKIILSKSTNRNQTVNSLDLYTVLINTHLAPLKSVVLNVN